jgi:hypothetical protein
LFAFPAFLSLDGLGRIKRARARTLAVAVGQCRVSQRSRPSQQMCAVAHTRGASSIYAQVIQVFADSRVDE